MAVTQLALLLLVLLSPAPCVLAAKRGARPRRQLIQETGPSEDDIWDTGLLEKTVSYATLYERGQQYYHDTARRRFQGPVLGYVTPWNRRGYDVAVRFRSKLTHIAPVWYQLKRENGKFVLGGAHEVNQTWISELRQGPGTPPLVTPRVIFELPPADMVEAVGEQEAAARKVLLQELADQGYDGLVLEVWSHWLHMNGLANTAFREAAFTFIRRLSHLLHKEGKQLLLAVPPILPAHHAMPALDRAAMLELSDAVDGWSLMTYDHAVKGPGPNAPLHWVRQNAELARDGAKNSGQEQLPPEKLQKVLLGLNFYGYDYSQDGTQALTAGDAMKLLKQHEPTLVWDDDSGEHSFLYVDASGKQHRAYYPTPRALEMRVEAAQQLGTGLSIWELGQGMDRFMDLL